MNPQGPDPDLYVENKYCYQNNSVFKNSYYIACTRTTATQSLQYHKRGVSWKCFNVNLNAYNTSGAKLVVQLLAEKSVKITHPC